MAAKMIEVAKEAGVSIATVSRVLNGKTVRPDLAVAVQAAIKKLEYSPNKAGRTLRKQSAEVIGLIVADIENPFFTAFARGVEDVSQQNNFSVVLCNSDESPRKEARYLQVAVAERMAGVIVCPADPALSLRDLAQQDISAVVADRALRDDLDHVLLDNERIARETTRELLRKGARRIACITGPASTQTAVDRGKGWASALAEAGVDVPDDYLVYTDFRISGGVRAANQLLHHGIRPDAILATNNLVAVGTLRAIDGQSEEILVGVVGELPYATSSPANVVMAPLHPAEMGRLAAQMLHERIAGSYKGRGRTVVMEPSQPSDSIF
ncbi:LacI family DNA-binding transcriptional regulator [Tessaracoccus massiliensis]|uniref:LacI family DNA-binding transcriptional regulator n=1 Tax=Tessaracoccus massiliensis TaxID=1522311 RepID=UPI00058B6E77|nr:LacI family DNA-binding transcriptional regulator [Tessaracoccus massiliensis]